MDDAIRTTKKLLIIYYFLILHIVAIYFIIDKIASMYRITPVSETSSGTLPGELAKPTPVATTPAAPGMANADPKPTQAQIVPVPSSSGLVIPVAGVSRQELRDSFADARSDERAHDAIDIAAPAGTPVVAAADGKILKFFESEAGGTTIYQLSADEKFVFYYAHLQGRAEDIKVGKEVKRGRTIGFVGDTGNAGAGNYHLHFSIMYVADPQRYWEGVYINPYPLLSQ